MTRSVRATCELCLRASRVSRRRLYSSEPLKPPPDEPGPSKARFDSQKAFDELRTRTSTASKALNVRSAALRKEIELRLVDIGQNFSRLTGYEHIESLKQQVEACEHALLAARTQAREAKESFETAMEARRLAQRESNDLLQRKSEWTEADVSRFTELVRKDHMTESESQEARRILAECEESVEKVFSAWMKAILARYHEEQVWSDKIRSVSTYGSLAITGANVVVFLLAILVVEPWRRNRLIEGVEQRLHERETERVERSEESMSVIVDRLDQAEGKLDEALARLLPSKPPARQSADTSIPDLGAVLRELMEADEAQEMAETDSTPWQNVAIAGVGGLLLGAISVAAMLWR